MHRASIRPVVLTVGLFAVNACSSAERALKNAEGDATGAITSTTGATAAPDGQDSGLTYSNAGVSGNDLTVQFGASSVLVKAELWSQTGNLVGLLTFTLPLKSTKGDLSSTNPRVCVCSEDQTGCEDDFETSPDPSWCETPTGTFSEAFDDSKCEGGACARNLDVTLTVPTGMRFSGTAHVAFSETFDQTSEGCSLPSAGQD